MKRTPMELARLLDSFGTHLQVTDWAALREAAEYIRMHEELAAESERVPEVEDESTACCKCGMEGAPNDGRPLEEGWRDDPKHGLFCPDCAPLLDRRIVCKIEVYPHKPEEPPVRYVTLPRESDR